MDANETFTFTCLPPNFVEQRHNLKTCKVDVVMPEIITTNKVGDHHKLNEYEASTSAQTNPSLLKTTSDTSRWLDDECDVITNPTKGEEKVAPAAHCIDCAADILPAPKRKSFSTPSITVDRSTSPLAPAFHLDGQVNFCGNCFQSFTSNLNVFRMTRV